MNLNYVCTIFYSPVLGLSYRAMMIDIIDHTDMLQYFTALYELNDVYLQDTCSKHPNRKLWAVKQCSLLKSELFQPCHSEVPVDNYFER